jgi:cytoplasmic iron level regulating protein YaaA (DUF328/UPF0246 family)
MPMLLVQSCSKSKVEAEHPVPALELYSGYYYKIIKKAKREGDFDPSIDLCILSAKHGLIEPDTELKPYDKRMDADRSRELRDDVTSELAHRVRTGDYDQVLVNMGQQYRATIEGLDDEVDVPIRTIEGRLGERGRKLKQWIRDSGPRSVRAH